MAKATDGEKVVAEAAIAMCALMGFLITLPVAMVVRGWVAVKLWGWILLPIYGVQVPTIAQVIGLSVLVSFAIPSRSNRDGKAQVVETFFQSMILSLLYLGIGYVVSFWV